MEIYGSSVNININRASNSFTHTLSYNFLGLTGTIATKTTQTIVAFKIPGSFYAKIPNATSGTVTITCQTYSGSTLVGSSTCTFRAIVFENDNKPSVSATVEDVNPVSLELTKDSNKLIRYISNAKVVITATAKNNATIKSVKVVNGSQTKTTVESTIEAIDSDTFVVSCIDSRGFTVSLSIKKEMIEYIKPVITDLQLQRPKTTSNTIQAQLQGLFYNAVLGTISNSIELKVRYKNAEDENWSNYTILTPNISENSFNLEQSLGDVFNYQNSYNFEFVVTDKILNYTTTITVTQRYTYYRYWEK